MAVLQLRETKGAISPPTGVEPDFVDPETRNTLIFTVTGICAAFSTVFLIVRLYTTLIASRRRYSWDDYLIIIGYLFSIVYFCMMPMGISLGAGRHLWDVPTPTYVEFSKRANMTYIIYDVSVCLVKLAIVAQINRIFVPSKATKIYWMVRIITILTLAFYFACFWYTVFTCTPRKKIWIPSTPGHCINIPAGIIVSAGFNMIFDFAVLILPIGCIWSLQMSTRKKWGITVIFAVGLFACISSIMRTIVSVNLTRSIDETWILIEVGAWCDAEIASGIVCCCLPVFPQFYRLRISPFVTSLRSLRSRSRTVDKSQSQGSELKKVTPSHPWNSKLGRNPFDDSPQLMDGIETHGLVTHISNNWGDDPRLESASDWSIEPGQIRRTVQIETHVG